MPASKRPRAVKGARPPADSSCTLTRVVERRGLRLEIWTCSARRSGEPLDEPPRLKIAPVVERIGRRNWRFWYVSREDAARDEGEGWGCEPGWWYNAANPDPSWVSNDPLGPFPTLEQAVDEVRTGVAEGWW